MRIQDPRDLGEMQRIRRPLDHSCPAVTLPDTPTPIPNRGRSTTAKDQHLMSISEQLSRFFSSAKRGDRTKARSRRLLPRVEPLEGRAVLATIATPPIFQNPFMAPNNF